jgi:hypothetical protein
MYVDRKRKASVHGNHIELQALCEMYNRPVQVFSYKTGVHHFYAGCTEYCVAAALLWHRFMGPTRDPIGLVNQSCCFCMCNMQKL